MVQKEKVAIRTIKILVVLFLGIVTSCNDNDTYEEKVDEINKDFVEQKKELLTTIIVEKLEDSISSEKSLKSLSELENNYEKKINELNDIFLGQEVIAPFELKKTTEVELAGYSMEVDLNIKNRTVFNVILNKVMGYIFEYVILAIFVIILSFFVNYSRTLKLIKVLFTHPIVIALFLGISIFFSPAEYFGLIASDLENETEKFIDLNFDKDSEM